MKVEQRILNGSKWDLVNSSSLEKKADLVLSFGCRKALEHKENFESLRALYPGAVILMASSSGDILNTTVKDDSIVATAIHFEKNTQLSTAKVHIQDYPNSYEAGKNLVQKINLQNLLHLFVIADGQQVNGSELIKGINSVIPAHVHVTGGLAGDGTNFKKTVLGLNEQPDSGNIVCIGFYGSSLKIGFGSMGGWDPFGVERRVTKSKGNILYELDGQSALDLYKKYLGEEAKRLPSSGLLFPLSIRFTKSSPPLVRTILNIDENEKSLIFAGDIPEGSYTQLMKANFDRLIDGAEGAANSCYETIGNQPPELAILISCVGRRLVLDQRIEEELESVKKVLGNQTFLSGFYSYGEIAPTAPRASCELHNQTMTITTLSER